jgi:hypothetical protein
VGLSELNHVAVRFGVQKQMYPALIDFFHS